MPETYDEATQRVENAIRQAFSELQSDSMPLYIINVNAGAGHCAGYSFYQPSSIDPYTLLPVPAIDGRGRATIMFQFVPADDRIWHERGHSIEALAYRRSHHGYYPYLPNPTYDGSTFNEEFWTIIGAEGTWAKHANDGWTSRSSEIFAEAFAVVNTGCNQLTAGPRIIPHDPTLLAFFHRILTPDYSVPSAPYPDAHYFGMNADGTLILWKRNAFDVPALYDRMGNLVV